jgi:hypothetical protein
VAKGVKANSTKKENSEFKRVTGQTDDHLLDMSPATADSEGMDGKVDKNEVGSMARGATSLN